MKKILSLILVAAMLMSLVVMTASAEESIGFGEYAPMAPVVSEEDAEQALDENQVDEQGVYYSLDDETMTAIVGKNTYADSASADAGLTTDSIVIPETVIFGGNDYNVVAIGRNAFDGTAIREVVVFSSVKTIGEFAFAGCTKLETVYSYGTTEIKGFAFWGCTSLNIVNMPGAMSIGGGAFWNCSNLKNIGFEAETIMEKAFEGCDNLEYIIFGGDAPAVAAGALGSVKKAYIFAEASGYEDFPIPTEILANPIIDIEDAYAKAGETVDVAIVAPAGAKIGDISIGLNIAEGLTVTEICGDATNGSIMNVVSFDAGTLSGNIDISLPGVLAILKVTLPADAAGTYEITATAEEYTTFAGSITICDHANTKTVTVKAASCDEAGIENTVCTACGTVLSTADVEAKGHSYKDFVIAPTCTEGGYTRHICDCCADAYTDAETEATGHAWDEGEVIVQVSTTKNGLVRYTCTTCGTTKDVTLTKIKYGDANGDTNINTSDASIILQHIANWDLSDKTFIDYNADTDGNGTIVLSDVSLLLKYIAGWDGIVLGPKK